MAQLVGEFATVQSLSATSVRFNMRDGSTIYVLWRNARLPSDVTGTLRVITYTGVESQQQATNIVGDVPVFVIVPKA